MSDAADDKNTPPATPPKDQNTPPATPPKDQNTPPAPPPTPSESDRELLAVQKEMARLAKENQTLREKSEALEAEKMAEQGKYKELYEKEKEARAKESQEARRRAAKAELRAYAAAQGIIDPDLADMISVRDLKTDEETGEYTNIKDLVETHKQNKPHLYRTERPTGDGTPPPNSGAGGNPPPATPPKEKDVSEMSRAEYQAHKAKFIQKLRAGKT